MDDIVGPIKTYLAKADPTKIDNFVFKLHVRVTFALMLSCMALVGAGQYFGSPISCMGDSAVPGGTMDLYCWIHSTFSVASRFGVATDEYGVGLPLEAGQSQPHPGVAPLVNLISSKNEALTKHKYYQWVIFFFFVQAMMFYIPRIFWKHAEGGLMKTLVGDLTNPLIPYKEEERVSQVKFIRKYFNDDLRTHGAYAINFFLCEILTFINVIGQIFFTDRFLGYQFTTYGLDVIKMTTMEPENRTDPMNVVFPKVTKCTFHMYGASGTIGKHDSLCVLPLNIINEKIFVFLWFWFVLVAVISGLSLIYRIITLFSLNLRVSVIKKKMHSRAHDNIIRAVLTCPNHNWLDQIGDYWVMFLLSKNLPAIAMKELLEELYPIMKPPSPRVEDQRDAGGFPEYDYEYKIE